jgi:hypothetical protein
MTKPVAASARDYVLKLDLPETGPVFEAARTARREFSDEREAIVVGAQLAEFTNEVPAGVRGAIADSILLAQLAANKAAAQSEDVFRWYDKYIEVLQNIGWELRDLDFQTQQVSDKNAGMHQAIAPVIMAMLGPQAAAASIVLAVLNGLQEMDTSTPWITLFDRSSQHAHGAKFQVSYVDADAQGQPEITLLCFGIQGQRTITQVLFFKFSEQSVEAKKAAGKMAVSMERMSSAKDLIADRVRPFIAEYVKNIDI